MRIARRSFSIETRGSFRGTTPPAAMEAAVSFARTRRATATTKGAAAVAAARALTPLRLLRLPRRQHFLLPIRRQPRPQLRPSLLRERLPPRERIPRRLVRRPELQPLPNRFLAVDLREARLLARPHRHVLPGADLVLLEERLRHPGQRRRTGGRLARRLQHRLHRKLLLRTGGVVDTHGPVLDDVHYEGGEIARVDVLHRIVAGSRGERFAAAIDADRPVGVAVGGIAGTDDEPGPDGGGAARHRLLDRPLAERLQRAVVLAHLLATRLLQFLHRGLFVC